MRRIIGITPEEKVFREQERISNILRCGAVNYFHIRKPHFSEQEMRNYLEAFALDIRKRLSLHDHFRLAEEMQIGGIHLNRRNPILPDNFNGQRISISCHSVEEVLEWKERCDYYFLSPIFNSISKQGYKSKFPPETLTALFREGVLDEKCCALSGVTHDKLQVLKEMGFSSAAMLSSLWELPKTIYISHQNSHFNYISGVQEALRGGIRFVQLRMKESSDEEVLAAARQLRNECDEHAALLTVNDRIHLLDSGLFDGVHVGRKDMPVAEAKKLTRNRYLLGATCNTFEEIVDAVQKGADYIGLGPFRFTETKKNLAPILGLAGYKRIMEMLRNANLSIPIYAIGGIALNDLTAIKATQVHGIALSSTILSSPNPQETVHSILQTF